LGSQKLGDDEGVDLVGFGFFPQGLSEFFHVKRIQKNRGKTFFFEKKVKIFPEAAGGFHADQKILRGDFEVLKLLPEALKALGRIFERGRSYFFALRVEQEIPVRLFGHINTETKHVFFLSP
jgi:hypothetical protein